MANAAAADARRMLTLQLSGGDGDLTAQLARVEGR
jgi:hypothetical protein